jgi:hypothetical protein
MIEDAEGIDIVIIEAGAILVDGTAEGCAQHIKTSFERGQRAVMLKLLSCDGGHQEVPSFLPSSFFLSFT